MSLAWCVPKRNQQGKLSLVFGETTTCNVMFFSFGPCCLVIPFSRNGIIFDNGQRSLSYGEDNLEKSVAWCVPKPNQRGKLSLVFGETNTCNVMFFFLLGLAAL
jgi:hypothetical protein